MPAIANITLYDGSTALTGLSAGTEGSRVMVPSFMNSEGVMTWYVEGEDVIDARDRITLSVKQPQKGSQVARVVIKVAIPVMDDTDDSLKVGEGLCTMEFVVPKRMTELQRVKLWAMAGYLLQGTGIATPVPHGDQNDYAYHAIVDLASPY
jgi:hypothetical protein